MSKLAALEWAQNDTWLAGIGELGADPQVFYRSMDFLLDCDEEIQREVFFAVSDLLNLEVDLILFDYPANVSDDEPSDDGGDEFSAEPAFAFA
jgi:hypothetical protein